MHFENQVVCRDPLRGTGYYTSQPWVGTALRYQPTANENIAPPARQSRSAAYHDEAPHRAISAAFHAFFIAGGVVRCERARVERVCHVAGRWCANALAGLMG